MAKAPFRSIHPSLSLFIHPQSCISGSRLPPSLLVVPRAIVNNVNRQRLGSPAWFRVRGGLIRCVAREL